MNLLNRYLVGHILAFTGIAALALIGIHTFVSFVTELDEVGQGRFGYFQLLQVTLLQMPEGLLTMLPIIAMLGTLMGLGTLAAQSELTVMRASGVSLLRLGGAALIAGLVLAVLALVLGDWAVPSGHQQASALRNEAKFGVAPGLGGRPFWLREGVHIYRIQRLLAEDHVAEVEIFSLAPDLGLTAVTSVADGTYDGDVWQFKDVNRTSFEEGGLKGAVAEHYDIYAWHSGLTPEVLRQFVLESESLSTQGLLRLIGYLEANQLDAYGYRLSLWRKLVAPLTVMVMMLLAVPFVLGPLRSSGAGLRLLIGVMLGLAFYVVNETTISIGEIYRWPPEAVAVAPTALVLAVAIWRLARER